MSDSNPSSPLATSFTLLWTATVAVAASMLSLPGLDGEAVNEINPGLQSMPRVGVSLVFFGLCWALAPLPAVRRWWPFLYAMTVAVQALTMAVLLEAMNLGNLSMVVSPGLGFRGLAVLTSLGVASISWWAMVHAEATGRVRGALWIGGWLVGLQLVGDLGSNALATLQGDDVFWPYPAAVACSALAMVAWGLMRPSPGLLRSAADAAFVPILCLFLGGMLAIAVPGVMAFAWMAPSAVAVVGLVGVVGLGIGHRRAGIAWLALLASPTPVVVAGMGVAVVFAQHSDVVLKALQPGPFEGDVTAVVVFEGSEVGANDVSVLLERLEKLEVELGPVQTGPSTVTVELRNVVSVQQVADAVLPKNWITFRSEVAQGEAFELCDDRRRCETLTLGPVEMDSTAIAGAVVGWREHGASYVLMTFTPAGAVQFGDYTAAHVRQRIAIVKDGVLVSAPMIMEPIRGGQASIDMGDGPDARTTANGLSIALRTPPLDGVWTLAEVRP